MTWENFKLKLRGPGTLSSRLPDGGSREQLRQGAGQGREPATLVRDPAQVSNRNGDAQDRSDQAGPTWAGEDWFLAHRLQVCRSNPGEPACSGSPLPSWGLPSL